MEAKAINAESLPIGQRPAGIRGIFACLIALLLLLHLVVNSKAIIFTLKRMVRK